MFYFIELHDAVDVTWFEFCPLPHAAFCHTSYLLTSHVSSFYLNPCQNLNSSKAGKQSQSGSTSKGKGVTLSEECEHILAKYHTKSNKSTSTKGCTTSGKSGKSVGKGSSMSYYGKAGKSGGSLTSKSGKSDCAEPSTPNSTPTSTPTSNPTKVKSHHVRQFIYSGHALFFDPKAACSC